MKTFLGLFSIIVICLSGCNRNKNNFNRTVKLDFKNQKCNCKLFVEVYKVGILNNLTADYLTDSTGFRIYAGTFDEENGFLHFKCLGDRISIEQIEKTKQIFKLDSTIVNKKLQVTPNLSYQLKAADVKVYSLKDLKRRRIFE